MRHDVLTESGRKISVVSHRSGERDLAIFDADDPDSSSDSIALTDDEAAALADVLGASLMLGQLAGLGDQTAGVFTEQISLPADSAYVGRPMGDTKARTRTSASIVAIVRGSQRHPLPHPRRILRARRHHRRRRHRSGLDCVEPFDRPRPQLSRGRAMHDTTVLLIEVGALLLGLSILGRLAIRIGISPIPLYLLAGLVFGKGGFAAAGRERGVLRGRLRDRRHPAARHARPRVLRGRAHEEPQGVPRRRAARRAASTPFPGAAFALILGWGPVAAVALAGITWVSSSGVIAKVMRDLGRLGNRETPGHPLHPRDRGPRHGVLPARAVRARDRRRTPRGRDDRGGRRHGRRRDPLRRAQARPLRRQAVLGAASRAAAARRARPHDARGGCRREGQRLGRGRRLPRRHRDLRPGRGTGGEGAHPACATCSPRCSSCSSVSPPTRTTFLPCCCPPWRSRS